MYISGNPRTPKDLRSIGYIIKRHWTPRFQSTSLDEEIRLPNKKWLQGFYRRHLDIKAQG
jgi:hypothetical protein